MTIGRLLDKAERDFIRRGVAEPRASAEMLLAHALGMGRGQLVLERGQNADPKKERLFLTLARRRARGVPIAYVLGVQPFLDFNLRASPQALIPRPETEELALLAIRALFPRRAQPLCVADWGTGSGCLAIALARAFARARVLAFDSSRRALSLARRNARDLGLGGRIIFKRGDFYARPKKPERWADMIVSNPPYVPSFRVKKARHGPDSEILKEPHAAFDGGPDGLDAVSAIIRLAALELKPDGILAMEIGVEKPGDGRRILSELNAAGFSPREILPDAERRPRFILARWKRF
ncbi:MAG: peptide chain release factor N(5)-glutamine methyltransferase [Elusimicrobiota bacterium]